ncbi:N-glycosylase/DNA lyase OGG1-like isoform X2 [Carya illinoinensis]|uniref:N-glycosylase/DNA lyase OGG1-like isoform X2 n=1 Tax=Carya illinoinensis TaxID=32201 RepID=UPI001C722938|nr:N-glycosylase/DNA lyase OGG1-like isoform X2 [Carya illinoinensis]
MFATWLFLSVTSGKSFGSDPSWRAIWAVAGCSDKTVPLKCLIPFLCSSNNMVITITKVVDFISSLRNYMGTVEGFEFHQFPNWERLAMVSEDYREKALLLLL